MRLAQTKPYINERPQRISRGYMALAIHFQRRFTWVNGYLLSCFGSFGALCLAYCVPSIELTGFSLPDPMRRSACPNHYLVSMENL